MLLVNKFWSHINYYNITHDMHDLVFKIVYLFSMNPENVCLFKVNNYQFAHLILVLRLITLDR